MKELIVYPTPYLVWQHRMAQLKGKIGVTGEYPVTYEVFIEKCIEDQVTSKIFLGDFKKNLILYQILQKQMTNLKYFDTPRQGYIKRIGEIIGELKRQDIDAKSFKNIVSQKPIHHDLFLIYQTYQEFLIKNRLYDKEDRYIICKDNVLKSEYIARWDKIHFEEFFDITPIQQKIIQALGSKAKLSNSDLKPKMKKVSVIKAQNRRTEVYNLAYTIIEDLKKGLLPEDICIVVRNRVNYEHLLHEVFEENRIPLRLEVSASLVQNPFIKSLLRFFQGELTDYFPEELQDERPEGSSIDDLAGYLKDFLEAHNYPEKFCDIHNGDIYLIRRDLEALITLEGLLDELRDIDRIISGEVTKLDNFINLLEFYLQNRSYICSPKKDGIWVLSPAMLRGLKFEKIYALGMVEGEFPRDFRPDWLLKEAERASINEKGYNLDTLDILIERELESFEFIKACSFTGYFSYPMVLEDNTSSLISLYLDELLEQYPSPAESVGFKSVFYPQVMEDSKQAVKAISEETKEQLNRYFCKKPFSTTAFNMYGECPYKFFLARVLNLSPVEEEDEYTALSRGTVIHKILEMFFKNYREGLDADKIDEYTTEIKILSDKIMRDANLEECFPHPLLFEIEKNEIVSGIIGYIGNHVKNRGDFKPIFSELSFGYKNNFSLDFAPDILLCGKIDRVDEDSEGRVVVFDYKTGSTPDIKQVEEGTNLQLPLYILAAEQLLKKQVVGGGFISIKKGSVDNLLVRDKNLPFISKRRKKGVLSHNEWNELMETVKNTIREYTDSIREGQFPCKPKKCPKLSRFGSFCDFTEVCPWEGEDMK